MAAPTGTLPRKVKHYVICIFNISGLNTKMIKMNTELSEKKLCEICWHILPFSMNIICFFVCSWWFCSTSSIQQSIKGFKNTNEWMPSTWNFRVTDFYVQYSFSLIFLNYKRSLQKKYKNFIVGYNYVPLL